MLYSKRTVRCSARGLSRDDAKRSLEQQFEGTELLDIKRRGDKWVATLLEPKTAEFPPSDDDSEPDEEKALPKEDSEGSDEPSPPKDDGDKSDGPPKDKGPKGGEKGELVQALNLLHQIADALGITPPMGAPGGDDPLAPPGGPPGPPPPGPGGPPGDPGVGGPGHQEIVHRTKLKPGDSPPGVTPIGSPAFASTLSRMASFDAFDDTPNKSIKQAKAELEALYGPHGFKVRQIKRVEGGRRLAAKLSRR